MQPVTFLQQDSSNQPNPPFQWIVKSSFSMNYWFLFDNRNDVLGAKPILSWIPSNIFASDAATVKTLVDTLLTFLVTLQHFAARSHKYCLSWFSQTLPLTSGMSVSEVHLTQRLRFDDFSQKLAYPSIHQIADTYTSAGIRQAIHPW